MSDFSAAIKAILDTSGIAKQLKDIEKLYQVEFKCGKLDTSEIESRARKAGESAGNGFSKSFGKSISSISSTLNNIHLKNGGIANISRMLQGAGFDKSSIASITQELDKMVLTVSKLSTQQLKNGNIRMTITGVDELNRTVRMVRDFDKSTGTVSNTTKTFVQSFDTGMYAAKRFQNEVSSAFSALKAKVDEINSLRVKLKGLDSSKNSSEIEQIQIRISQLTSECRDLYGVFGGSFSTEQMDRLNDSLSKTDSKISILNGKMNDTSAATSQNQKFESLYDTLQKINSLKIDIKKLELNGGSEAQIEILKSQLESLRETFKALSKDSNASLSTEQFAKLKKSCIETTGAISELETKSEVAKQKLSEEIKFKIDNGSLTADFKSIEIMVDKAKSLGAMLSGDVGKNYTELKSALDIMEKTDGTVSIEQKIDAYKRFNELLPIVRQQVSNLTKEEQAAAKTEKENSAKELTLIKSNKLSSDITDWMNKNTKAADVFGSRLEDLKSRLSGLNELDGDKASEELRKITTEFAAIKSEAKASGLVTNSFAKSLKDTAKQLLGLTSTVAVIQQVIRVVKEMYQCVYDIDTAMTNLKKVTDETDISYSAFLSRAAKSAKSLGRTVSEMVTQTAEWSKLGYTLNAAEELSKWSSIYANVGEVDEKTAVSDMVTAMKAFNIEASNAQTIVDSLNELGNKFAVSSADLGAGLSNSASAMNAAGTDMNKTLAMLTGGAEITQNAGEFGNFLKTASMRIRGMKGELEALGEEVGDNVDSISKVQTQILNLTHGEVNIFDDKGEFRDYYDIIKDISGVVDHLTSTERASLYEILFGKVRSNQGSALIQAFQSGQIENAYNSALSSTGSAMKEQEKWIESLEGKTQQFKTAWQELSNTVLDSESIKFLIDAGTTFLSILTDIIDAVGTLPALLSGIGITALIKNFD